MLATHTKDFQLFKIIDFLIHAKNPIVFLAIKIHSLNTGYLDYFFGSTKFDIKELEIYARLIQGLNSIEWTGVIEEKLDQL